MRKTFICSILSIFLFSCESRENEVNFVKHENSSPSEKQSASVASFTFIENQIITCGSSGSGNPFVYVPNMNGIFLKYTTDNSNVFFQDDYDIINSCHTGNGKQCVTLSKFVGSGIVSLSDMRKIEWYFGRQKYEGEFYGAPGSYTEEFNIGQDGYNAQLYGDLFWSPNYYMTDIAANSVRQKFKDQMDVLKAQNKKIKSISIYTDALLCIPPYKFIRLSVKYDY